LRTQKELKLQNTDHFKSKLLAWAQKYDEVVFLDSNEHSGNYHQFNGVLAADAFTSIKTDAHLAFEDLHSYQSVTKDWVFGYLTYDLKNDTEPLCSGNFDGIQFPDLYFFQPKKLIFIKDEEVVFNYLNVVAEEIIPDFEAIKQTQLNVPTEAAEIKIKLRIHRDAYIDKVEKMLDHIQRGDIYEANFCQEFYAEDTPINPLQTFWKLNDISKPPFATFLKLDGNYLLSASPERYLRKEGQKVISQPIKGTAKRHLNEVKDDALKRALEEDEKERSENIMIVDLVRNDLSHTAKRGSVAVEELCKVYSFMQVHQMVSTVSSTVKDDVSPVEIIKSTFPMGSMTGAPKISAMTIIEDLEVTRRGLYSGAVGYFTPENDFDFNVVIRSILFNSETNYASFSVGSAITAKSQPIKEYKECLIKAKAMKLALE